MPILLIVKPLCIALLAILFIQYSGIDLYLSGLVYLPAEHWQLKNSWLLDTVIHRGGRLVIAVAVMSMLLMTLLSLLPRYRNHAYRSVCIYLLVATLLSIGTVSLLKQITTLPCPWDVVGLGGNRHYLLLGQVFSPRLQTGHCFPSGHASGGFALFSIYFAALRVSQLRRYSDTGRTEKLWLLPGLITGTVFGLAQQLRGAHFLSHDIASAAVCWFVCGTLAVILWPPESAQNVIRVPTISAD
ncbi:phosphatase PAP2 family protein [Neptunicella sp. SCSIO 80796]|uniref:phosphatase PAP2 family protein n=1 Tax=Neptunicella plasticusilytica TaxID=3117012 RepID=UPI003A4D324D